MTQDYDPSKWFWIVGGDEDRYWSSAAAAYVDELPPGAGVTRIASEAELRDVLDATYPAGSPVDLPTLKVRLKAQIDAEAEAERLRYVTGGAGQAMTYREKVEEARAVDAAAGDLDPADFPVLAATIGIDGPDIRAVAATVLASYAAWKQIGGAIEGTRLAAKAAVDATESPAEARAIAAAVSWPP